MVFAPFFKQELQSKPLSSLITAGGDDHEHARQQSSDRAGFEGVDSKFEDGLA